MADKELSAASRAPHQSSSGYTSVATPRLPLARPVHRALPTAQTAELGVLRDVQLDVRIELGKTRMRIQDVLTLARGSVVELDRLAADPVDIIINDRLVARGEVVVIDGNLGVRIDEIMATVNAGQI